MENAALSEYNLQNLHKSIDIPPVIGQTKIFLVPALQNTNVLIICIDCQS